MDHRSSPGQAQRSRQIEALIQTRSCARGSSGQPGLCLCRLVFEAMARHRMIDEVRCDDRWRERAGRCRICRVGALQRTRPPLLAAIEAGLRCAPWLPAPGGGCPARFQRQRPDSRRGAGSSGAFGESSLPASRSASSAHVIQASAIRSSAAWCSAGISFDSRRHSCAYFLNIAGSRIQCPFMIIYTRFQRGTEPCRSSFARC